MERKASKIFVGIWFLFAVCLIAPEILSGDPTDGAKPTLETGERLPRIFFPSLAPEENRYLGIGKRKRFTFDDIQARLILIDYINTNCPNCIKSVPTFVEISQRIEQDPTLKGKVKLLAIGAGDTSTEVKNFKENFGIPFPILPDEDFKAHDAVGAPEFRS